MPWPWTATVTIGWPSPKPSVRLYSAVELVLRVSVCGVPTVRHVELQ